MSPQAESIRAMAPARASLKAMRFCMKDSFVEMKYSAKAAPKPKPLDLKRLSSVHRRKLAGDALNQITHREEISIGSDLTGLQDFLAGVVDDRAGEGMEFTLFHLFGRRLDIVDHALRGGLRNVDERHHVFRDAAPDGLRLPGAVHDGLDAAFIEAVPDLMMPPRSIVGAARFIEVL